MAGAKLMVDRSCCPALQQLRARSTPKSLLGSWWGMPGARMCYMWRVVLEAAPGHCGDQVVATQG